MSITANPTTQPTTLVEKPSQAPPSLQSPTVAAGAESIKRQRAFGKPFYFFAGWLGLVIICAIGGKRLPFADRDPDYLTGALINDGKWAKVFSLNHPLGTSQNGDDWLATAILGARNSLIIAFATILLGFLVGGVLGMMAGYLKGRVDTLFNFFMTVLQSFPPLLFIILLLTILAAGGNSSGVAQGLQTTVWKLSLALGILSVPTLFRVVRASTMQFASREFVLAARAMGASNTRVILREILPNVVKPMAAYGLVGAGNVMVIEGGLSFLGIGVGDAWAWGKMISTGSGTSILQNAPNVAFVPVIILFMTVLSFNFIGDKLRERLEVQEGGI
jgi:peptide/nickel transport system permease protein